MGSRCRKALNRNPKGSPRFRA
ncbi:hypothetical protein CNEO4_1040004 [Clostridium neonatale]|nr:hypothetical protein CNEO4_1040004 [Clostridium neonatale]